MVKTAVAIGHFGMPGIVDLNLRLIRDHCGDVPVLVCDDHTEQAFDPSRGETAAAGRERRERLRAVCRTHGAVLVTAARERCFHAGGDLGAFYHGLRFARRVGARVLAKLSMRFLVDRRGWLRDAADHLLDLDYPTGSHECRYGSRVWFRLRSEHVLMDVAEWGRPDVMAELRPRPLGGVAAESLLWRVMADNDWATLAGPRHFGPDRLTRYPGVVWHDSHGPADYRDLAGRYGADLGTEFHADGQHMTRGYGGF